MVREQPHFITIRVEQAGGERGVCVTAVVTLPIVFEGDLPVAGQFHGTAMVELGFAEARGELRQFVAYAGKKRVEGGCRGVQIDQNQFAHFLNRDRRQRNLSRIETRHVFGIGRAAQATVEAVGPGVIGTGDGDLEYALALQQTMTAMLADIVEGAQYAIASAHDRKVLADDVAGEVGSRIGDVGPVAGDLPAAPEDTITFPAIESVIGVTP